MTAKQALNRLKSTLDKKINAALSREVLDVVKQAESDAADRVVYSMPTSGYYQRRGDGERHGYGEGIGDPVNMVIEGGSAKNGRLVVINETEPNPYLNGVNGDRATVNKSLVYVIEHGQGYDYWKRPKSRPFIAATRRDLKQSCAHITALKHGLKRQGVNVK